MPLPLWGTVRLDTDERLDKPDALALQNMNMEYMVRSIGAAFGWGGGCTTPPTVTFQTATSPRTLKLGGFQYYVCEPFLPEDPVAGSSTFQTVYKGFRGNFLTFDPSDSGQVTDIPFDSVWAIAQANYANPIDSMYPFLYAQPIAVDVDADARILWDTAVPAGLPATIKTRTVLRHVFVFSTQLPQNMLGWAPILQIDWPSLNPLVGPGEPSVRYIGWKDTELSQMFTSSAGMTYSPTALTPILSAKQSESDTAVQYSYIEPTATPFKDAGLIQVLQILQANRVRDMALAGTRPWFQQQAGTDQSVRVAMLDVIDKVNAMYPTPYVYASCYVRYTGGVYTIVEGMYGTYGVQGIVVPIGGGAARVDLTTPIPANLFVSAQVTAVPEGQAGCVPWPLGVVPITGILVQTHDPGGTPTPMSFMLTVFAKRS